MTPRLPMPQAETIEIEPEVADQEAATDSHKPAGAVATEGEDTETEAADSELESLRTDLESAHEELEALQDRLLRAQAEFANTRKRIQREKEEVIRYAAFDTIESLLPVVDDIETAIGSEHVTSEVKKGLEQIHQKMFAVFERAGLKPVDQHETFDPHLHEALARAPATEDQADHQILEVWRKGYLFKERLMRASWVKVAVRD